ncbi:hypothetical protein L6164_029691 [Bauhinia variegata]|uniref:Uncharacterized protein n=1 Tax=Bauhinia variegata TaxID=167791 RepID=A0ACB9LAC9_BAUVA|nr:hypothetical protein L6164_029691 [Bauhinia variegata]
MCSNTSSSDGGGGCGCNGGNGNGGVWSSSGLKIKQQKRPKIPKRGPGVAELEKIIREQNGEGFSSPCFNSYQNQTYPCNPLSLKPDPTPPPLPPPPSMTVTPRRMAVPASHSCSSPSHVPLAPKLDLLGPSTLPNMAALYGNGGYDAALGRSNGGSGLVSPEQPFFPLNPSSCRSNIDGLDGSQSDSSNPSSRNLSKEPNPFWSFPRLIPKRQNTQCPPPMMNDQFVGSGTPAPPSPTSLPFELHNHVEPPSNQSSFYNYTARATEEQKIFGTKRPQPLSMSLDNSLVPPSHLQYPPNLLSYNRPHQSSPNDNHSPNCFTSPNESYRDAKWGSTLELYDNGGLSHENFPAFGAPSPPMHMFQRELSKCSVLPYQVPERRIEDSYQMLGSYHKPFYSFLEVKEQLGKKDVAPGSNHEDCEAGAGGIDLSLKL